MTIEIEVRDPSGPDMIVILQTHLDFCMSSTLLQHVHRQYLYDQIFS
jgi:hypothetical protein